MILHFPKITDARGALTVIESGVQAPFSIERLYYLYDAPCDVERGQHAHKTLHQVIIAISGSFDVVLDDGKDRCKYTLNKPHQGLYVGPMHWRILDNFSSGSVCLVLASAKYDEADYIRNYDDFLAAVGGRDEDCTCR